MNTSTAPGAVRPIETNYGGYRFRSRLEARWAVFFDSLGVQWRYESQGYELPGGRYLPDFWLPAGSEDGTQGIWVEVKGSIDGFGIEKLMNAAIHLPGMADWNLDHHRSHQSKSKVLVLGDLPRPGEGAPTHCRISMAPGGLALVLQRVFFDVLKVGSPPAVRPIGDSVEFRIEEGLLPPYIADDDYVDILQVWLTKSPLSRRLRPLPIVEGAYQAARAARFEHGESGS